MILPISPDGRPSEAPAGAKDGGAGRDRTDDPLLAKQVLSQLSYGPICLPIRTGRPEAEGFARPTGRRGSCRAPSGASPKGERREDKTMVGLDRLELSTSPLSGVRSNHLSYRPERLRPGHPSTNGRRYCAPKHRLRKRDCASPAS
jgi:hypothetical protein